MQGRVADAMEWEEGMPWRPFDLREDAHGGGMLLNPWGERRLEENTMAVAAVIFFS